MPTSRSARLTTGGSATRLVVIAVSAYGLISKLRRCVGVSSPISVPADEILEDPRRPQDCGTSVRNELSFFQRTSRLKLTPQVPLPSLKRIDRNGISISTVHPPSNSPVRAVQRVFQF